MNKEIKKGKAGEIMKGIKNALGVLIVCIVMMTGVTHAISLGGSPANRVDYFPGKVGLGAGNLTPTEVLDVSGNINSNGTVSANKLQGWLDYSWLSGNSIVVTHGQVISAAAQIINTGNVSIKAGTDASALINFRINNTDVAQISTAGIKTDGTIALKKQGSVPSTINNYGQLYVNNSNVLYYLSDSGENTAIQAATATSMDASGLVGAIKVQTANEAMRIDTLGNIGLGLANIDPTYKLEVGGKVSANYFYGNLDWSYIQSHPTFVSADQIISASARVVNTSDVIINAGDGATGKILMQVNGSTKMTVSSNGYVGIGVAAPTQMLDVNGIIKATKVTANSFEGRISSDYVDFLGGIEGSNKVWLWKSAGKGEWGDLTIPGTVQETKSSTDAIVRADSDNDSTGNIKFIIGSGASSAMEISNNSKVAIGTTNFTEALNVGGTINAVALLLPNARINEAGHMAINTTNISSELNVGGVITAVSFNGDIDFSHVKNFPTNGVTTGMQIEYANNVQGTVNVTIEAGHTADTSRIIDMKIAGSSKMTINSSNVVMNVGVVYAPSTVQSLGTSSQITANKAIIQVVGNPGAVTLPANPIIAGSDGQEITIIGTSDSNTVQISNVAGVKLDSNAPFTLGDNDMIKLIYIATKGWVELSRSDN